MYIRLISRFQESEKQVTKQKRSKKDSQLVLRLPKEERDAFVQLCDDLDTSAAREIRHFIRRFLKDEQKKSNGD